MRTIFRFFRRNPSHGLESLLGIFWTIAISFLHPCGDHLFHRFSSSGMDGVGRAAQKVVYQVGNLFGDQGFVSRLGWHLAHRRRRRTIMSIVVLAGKKQRLRFI